MKSNTVTAVIPCRNEFSTIKSVVRDVNSYVDEVIVVDNSLDRNRIIDLLKNERVRLIFTDKKGKGYALRMGIRQAIGDIILFFDSDGSHRAEEIPNLVKAIFNKDVSMVVGSRILGYSEEYYGCFSEKIRLAGNKLVTKIINLIWKADLTDTQNGLRIILKDVILGLNLREKEFAIEQEMIIKCLKSGNRVYEIPSYEKRRQYGKSNINPFVMLPKYVFNLFREILGYV